MFTVELTTKEVIRKLIKRCMIKASHFLEYQTVPYVVHFIQEIITNTLRTSGDTINNLYRGMHTFTYLVNFASLFYTDTSLLILVVYNEHLAALCMLTDRSLFQICYSKQGQPQWFCPLYDTCNCCPIL